jgi:hypothetical protein
MCLLKPKSGIDRILVNLKVDIYACSVTHLILLIILPLKSTLWYDFNSYMWYVFVYA